MIYGISTQKMFKSTCPHKNLKKGRLSPSMQNNPLVFPKFKYNLLLLIQILSLTSIVPYSGLLLNFRGTRESDWDLHIESAGQMISWFFAYDKLN